MIARIIVIVLLIWMLYQIKEINLKIPRIESVTKKEQVNVKSSRYQVCSIQN